MSSISPPISLNIPPSENTVNVRIIDSSARIRVPTAAFIRDPVKGHEYLQCPSFVFLIEHGSGQKVLFDLGVRKDVENFPPAIIAMMKGVELKVESDIASILERDGDLKTSDINAIIWSHWHPDHTGDPSTFPSTTDLVVGPGFSGAMLPGFPENEGGLVLKSDYKGRKLHEIDFENDNGKLKLGRFNALDYFGDGSFYLFDTPGHTIGHICALARTTPTAFIFMGGDICHHGGSFRPTKHVPLPDSLSPSPLSIPPHLSGTICPGSLLQSMHPKNCRTEPFYEHLSEAPDRDVDAATESIRKLEEFDADENVFVAIAHDTGLLDVVDFYPRVANGWKEHGWRKKGRWRFIEDFKGLLG